MTRRKAQTAQTVAAYDDAAFPEEVAAPPAKDTALPPSAGYEPDDGTFPDDEPSELADALVGPEQVANADRVTRQRLAFGGAAPAKPRAAPRRVSAEVVKAETKLLALERRRQESFAHAETVWAQKRVALILSFPEDVTAALVAMGVLGAEDPR
jgi:hypothetical protein